VTVYYLSDNPSDPNAPGGSTITSATTFTPASGDTFFVSDDWDHATSFGGTNDFSIQFNETKTAPTENTFTFSDTTEPTVLVVDGVDIGTTNFDADGDSLTVNIGPGASVGAIDGAGITNGGTFQVTAGNSVTTGQITGSEQSGSINTANFGTNADIAGVTMDAADSGSNTTENSVTLGENSHVATNIKMLGDSSTSELFPMSINIGDGTTIDGSIVVNGDGTAFTLDIGNDVTINEIILRPDYTDQVSFTAGDNLTINGQFNASEVNFSSVTYEFGDNLYVGAEFFTGYSSNDTVIIGDNWVFGGNVHLQSGDDDLFLGTNNTTLQTNTVIIYGGGGSDGITVASTGAAFDSAAAAAGWTDNGDGTWSMSASATPLIAGNVTYGEEFQRAAVCFAAATWIKTDQDAETLIENLAVGDLVLTADHGLQPIRWISARRLSALELAANPNLRPIRIRVGALGPGLPRAALVVSPQHRMLVRSKVAECMFGKTEVLVAAKLLLSIDGISVAQDLKEVTYYHFLCDHHEVVFAQGSPSESLYAGPEALNALTRASREEIFTIFPDLAKNTPPSHPARSLIKGKDARMLAFRHKKNCKAMLA